MDGATEHGGGERLLDAGSEAGGFITVVSRLPIGPARRALNPVLSDASVIEADQAAGSVFFTPAARALDRHLELIIAAAAGVFLLAGYITQWTGGARALENLFILLAFSIAGVPALHSVWGSVQRFRIDIDTLMLLGAGLAAVIGHPDEGALLLFLFALSGGLERYALNRTRAAITSLRDLTPSEAIVVDGEHLRTVRLKAVQLGQHVLVRPGDRVPLDGVVIEGQSALDESAITGESMPRDKAAGDQVFAGTFNTHGRLIIEVTKLVEDTTLARIVRLVTEARHKQAQVERLIDRIGPTYSVMVIAGSITAGVLLGLFGLSWQEAVRRAIAVLIVGSPCALIIATPVAYLSAIAAAARRGVLIKGGVYLEALARAGVIVFDKTGTLTTGHVRLAGVEVLDGRVPHPSQPHREGWWTDAPPSHAAQDGGVTPDEALRLAAGVEASSTHPLATALADGLHARGLTAPAASDVTSVAGQSLSGRVEDKSIWIGRPNLAIEHMPHDLREKFAERVDVNRSHGRTVSALLVDSHPAILLFEDTLRPDAAAAINALRQQGVRRLEMVTGDHALVAKVIAEAVGLDGFQAELLPEEKVAIADGLRAHYGPVVMIGDGVNDAPALARADVGIAIGSIGADIALDAAPIVLMNDRLENLSWLHRHALRTSRIVRENLTLAIGVIVTLSIFAVLGRIPLPLAVIGHEGSTVLVALNALRLLRSRAG